VRGPPKEKLTVTTYREKGKEVVWQYGPEGPRDGGRETTRKMRGQIVTGKVRVPGLMMVRGKDRVIE